MKLKVCKSIPDEIRNAKTINFSNKHIVICTGTRAIIYDKEFNWLKEYNNLSYVYTAKISPNEKFVVLISNTNKFYIINLEDYTISKHSVCKEYKNNLEGRGCWGNNDELYIIVENKITHKSCIRKYDLTKNMSYIELLSQKYRFIGIDFEPKLNSLIIIGQDMKKSMCDRDDDYRLILFNGETFIDYTLEKEDDIVISFEYNTSTKSINLYGLSKAWCCNIKGERVDSINLPNNPSIVFELHSSSYNIFNNEQIKTLAELLNLKFTNIDDHITKIVTSWDKKYYFIGTKTGLFVVNAKNNAIEDQVAIQYGVTDILQFSKNIIFISTLDKVKVYELN